MVIPSLDQIFSFLRNLVTILELTKLVIDLGKRAIAWIRKRLSDSFRNRLR